MWRSHATTRPQRIYVQQLIRDRADKVMALLDRGGLVYVCGDASRMAPDVRSAFAEVYAGRQQSRGWCAADR